MDGSTTGVIYDPHAPEVIADPYPAYALLRDHDPVHWSEPMNAWVLSRYQDVTVVLRDDERFSADRTTSENFTEDRRAPARSMLGSDPPDHTRLRTLVNKAFTPRTVRNLIQRITSIVDDLLDVAERRGTIDAIGDFAYPIPVTVIAEMLGVPPSDHERFHAWSEAIAIALGPQAPPDAEERAMDGRTQLWEYLSEIVGERRRAPTDDLISELIKAEEDGDVLTEAELLVMCILLLIAGHETTVNLIGNGLLALLRRPDDLARFRGDERVTQTAIEELLRYDSPVQFTSRVAKTTVEIDGRMIRPRQSVITLIGSANRDPDHFTDPDSLVLDRMPNPHLSFSSGIHYCLGAQLARVEGRIALTSLLRRFPDVRVVDDDVTWRPAPILRGLAALPVDLRGG